MFLALQPGGPAPTLAPGGLPCKLQPALHLLICSALPQHSPKILLETPQHVISGNRVQESHLQQNPQSWAGERWPSIPRQALSAELSPCPNQCLRYSIILRLARCSPDCSPCHP